MHPDGWIVAFPPTNRPLKTLFEKKFPEAVLDKRECDDTNMLYNYLVPDGDGVATRLQTFAEAAEVKGTRFPFEYTERARAKLLRELADAEASRLLAGNISPSRDIVVPDFRLELRPYQLAALEFAEKRNVWFNFDEPGVGKTFPAMAWVHMNDHYPCLVVCPANARSNWQEEYERVLGDVVKVKVLPSTPENFGVDHSLADWAKSPGKRIVIGVYNSLHLWAPWLKSIQWRSLLMDELHYARKISARRTRSLLEIARDVPNRHGLTGTPQVRDTRDFNSQFAALGVSQLFRGYAALTGKGTEADELAFNRRLAEIAVRRKRVDVLAQLPELDVQWHTVDVDDGAQREYVEAEDRFLKQAEHTVGDMRMPMGTLRRLVGEAKVQPILEWMEPRWKTPMVPLIFCYHHSVMDAIGVALEAEGIHTVRFDGTMSLAQKDRARKSFQEGNGRCFLAQIEAAGVALNLQRADTVLFTEIDWLPASHAQALARAHRSGSKHDKVEVHYLTAPKTIDEDIKAVLTKRQRSVGVVVDGEVGPAAVLQRLLERRGQSSGD